MYLVRYRWAKRVEPRSVSLRYAHPGSAWKKLTSLICCSISRRKAKEYARVDVRYCQSPQLLDRTVFQTLFIRGGWQQQMAVPLLYIKPASPGLWSGNLFSSSTHTLLRYPITWSRIPYTLHALWEIIALSDVLSFSVMWFSMLLRFVLLGADYL